jgi:hypothetical protein
MPYYKARQNSSNFCAGFMIFLNPAYALCGLYENPKPASSSSLGKWSLGTLKLSGKGHYQMQATHRFTSHGHVF